MEYTDIGLGVAVHEVQAASTGNAVNCFQVYVHSLSCILGDSQTVGNGCRLSLAVEVQQLAVLLIHCHLISSAESGVGHQSGLCFRNRLGYRRIGYGRLGHIGLDLHINQRNANSSMPCLVGINTVGTVAAVIAEGLILQNVGDVEQAVLSIYNGQSPISALCRQCAGNIDAVKGSGHVQISAVAVHDLDGLIVAVVDQDEDILSCQVFNGADSRGLQITVIVACIQSLDGMR